MQNKQQENLSPVEEMDFPRKKITFENQGFLLFSIVGFFSNLYFEPISLQYCFSCFLQNKQLLSLKWIWVEEFKFYKGISKTVTVLNLLINYYLTLFVSWSKAVLIMTNCCLDNRFCWKILFYTALNASEAKIQPSFTLISMEDNRFLEIV